MGAWVDVMGAGPGTTRHASRRSLTPPPRAGRCCSYNAKRRSSGAVRANCRSRARYSRSRVVASICLSSSCRSSACPSEYARATTKRVSVVTQTAPRIRDRLPSAVCRATGGRVAEVERLP